MAFDPSRDFLVAELKAEAPGDILKFSTNGSQMVFACDIGRPEAITSCFTQVGETALRARAQCAQLWRNSNET